MRSLLAFACLAIAWHARAQETETETKKKIFFKETGGTILMDYYQLPAQRHIGVHYSGNNTPIPDTSYERGFGFSLVAFQFILRHNIFTLNDNNAIGISAAPCIGFGLGGGAGDDIGIGVGNLPVYITYETGAGSTFSTVKDYGFFIGAGFELCKAPLIWMDHKGYPDGTSYPSAFAEPVCTSGFRYWKAPKLGGAEHLRELGIKFGMGPPRVYQDFQTRALTTSRSFSIRAYYSVFFDY